MGKLSFFFKEAFGSLRRNYFMTIAALVTVFLSVMVLGVVLVFVFTTNDMLQGVEKKVNIKVFFVTDPADPTPDQMTQMQTTISGWPEVKEVGFVSKEDGFEDMKDQFKDHPEMFEGLPSNPLPNKLVVDLSDPTLVDSIAARIEALDPDHKVIDEVNYGQELADKVFAMTSRVRNILTGFIAMLGVVSVLLISNTIRLSIFARKREVEIMKLVGATNWFIRWPFIIEGVTVGLVGAAAAAVTVIFVNNYGVGKLRGMLQWMAPSADSVPTMTVVLILLGMGVFIGAVGSGLGLRRLLKI